MGCCQSRVSIKKEKNNIIDINIDELYVKALRHKSDLNIQGYQFRKKHGIFIHGINDYDIQVKHNDISTMNISIDNESFSKIIKTNIEDHDKIWKCLNLIGHFNNLEYFINTILDDGGIRFVCVNILHDRMIVKRYNNSLLSLQDVGFICNLK